MLGDPCEHSRPNFVVVVKGKDVIGPIGPLKNTMRSTRLTFASPPNPQQRGQHSSGFCRGPLAHGVTAKTLPISGTGSP